MIGAIARLAVLPIIVAPSPDLNASKVFAAVDEAAQLRRTLRVMSIDDYFFHEGGELANRALACGEDTACIAKQLAPFDADQRQLAARIALARGDADTEADRPGHLKGRIALAIVDIQSGGCRGQSPVHQLRGDADNIPGNPWFICTRCASS